MSSEISLGDLVRTIRALAPDVQALNAIAAALGVRPVGPREPTGADAGGGSVAYLPPDVGLRDARPYAAGERPGHPKHVVLPDEAPAEFTVEWQPAGVALTAPASLSGLPDLDHSRRPRNHLRHHLDQAQLLPPGRERTLVAAACGRYIASGELDIESLVQHLASGQSVAAIPRRGVWTLRRGCQLLIDVGEAMAPFADDCRHLETVIKRVVGGDGVQVLWFKGCPTADAGAGAGPVWDWKPYAPPGNGRPIVVLSDVCSANHLVRRRIAPKQWERFGSLVAGAGSPVIALVPYPSRWWPASLRPLMTFVQWDRDLDVRQVATAVLGAASSLRRART